MANVNLEAFRMAVRASNALEAAEHERDFADRYHQAIAASGLDYADALAGSESLFLLINGELDFEGAAYLKSLIS